MITSFGYLAENILRNYSNYIPATTLNKTVIEKATKITGCKTENIVSYHCSVIGVT